MGGPWWNVGRRGGQLAGKRRPESLVGHYSLFAVREGVGEGGQKYIQKNNPTPFIDLWDHAYFLQKGYRKGCVQYKAGDKVRNWSLSRPGRLKSMVSSVVSPDRKEWAWHRDSRILQTFEVIVQHKLY